ncbi:histone-lysine N-methyltransferase ASHR3-like isoform X2 [Durio zibethinus]|uniref:Histone-lysine N-methyltransferase ASHR3-like isoform X2 n=1 Tax=Durio zibethinus TaxID=66656 RepID=A0A6P5ZAI3_DURZI|nr:histone-lysine N-methyltransferase ASHR3-like isoform X2 [Durio zibethinus]
MESGVPESRCFLPFLVGSKKLVECIHCHKLIYPGEEVCCSVRGCQGVYHKICAKESLKMSNPKKIPVSAAYRLQWQCVCCTISSHDKCSPWLDVVIHLKDKPGKAICWRHPTNWRLGLTYLLNEQHAVPATEVEEIFCQLPLPYVDEEFKLDLICRELMENKLEPPPYVHIKCHVYLVKKTCYDADDDIGCKSCSSACSEDCVCGY